MKAFRPAVAMDGGLVAGNLSYMPSSRWCVYIPERHDVVG